MAHFYFLVLCAASVVLVFGNDKLENHKYYQILSAGNNDLCMEAEEGVYNEYLGQVHLKPCEPKNKAQRWEYTLNYEDSYFRSSENTYNNVSTSHRKDGYHTGNRMRVAEKSRTTYVLQKYEAKKARRCLQLVGDDQLIGLEKCSGNADQLWKFTQVEGD